MSTRRGPASLALVAWTLLVWTTRIRNIWGDAALSDADKWGRTALALSFTVLALAVAAAVVRRATWRGLAVRLLAGWTIGVWITRSVGIVNGDHETSFVVVHLVLAVVSWGLAGLALRECRAEPTLAEASPSQGAGSVRS